MNLVLQWKGDIRHNLYSPLNLSLLKDVQFWSSVPSSSTTPSVTTATGTTAMSSSSTLSSSLLFDKHASIQSVDYIDPQKIPPWNIYTGHGIWQVASKDPQTRQFFNEMVKTSDCGDDNNDGNSNNSFQILPCANIGLLLEVTNSGAVGKAQYIMIYISRRFGDKNNTNETTTIDGPSPPKLCAIPVIKNDSAFEQTLIETKAEPDTARFVIAESGYLKKQKESKFNRLIERARSTTPAPRLATPSDSVSSVAYNTTRPDIYKRPSNSGIAGTGGGGMESAQERKNKTTITQVIMSELRLRGIRKSSDSNDDFKQLYNHAYKSTVFAFRRGIGSPIELETIRDKVDKVLNVLE